MDGDRDMNRGMGETEGQGERRRDRDRDRGQVGCGRTCNLFPLEGCIRITVDSIQV